MSSLLKRYSDVIASIVLLLFSIVMFLGTLNMKRLTDMAIGSEFAPRLVAAGIFILSLILFVNGLKKAREQDGESDELEDHADDSNEKEAINYKKVLIVILLFAMYVALMRPIGFLLMTIIYLFTTMVVLADQTQRNIPLFFIVSVVTSCFVYFIFRNVFYLFLPAGILG